MNKIHTLYKINGRFEFYQNGLVTITGDYKLSNVCLYDNDFNLTAKIESESAYEFIIEDDKVLFTTQKATNSFISELNTNDLRIVRELPYVLHLRGYSKDKMYFCFANVGDEECYLLIDLDTFDIVQKYNNQMGFYNPAYNVYTGIKHFLGNHFVSTVEYKGLIGLFNFNNDILWQQDLSELAVYKNWEGHHKGEISRVYNYKNQVIVTVGQSVVGLDVTTGEILWHVQYDDFKPLTLHIVDNKAYLAKGIFFSVLDLESGKKLLETKTIKPFPVNESKESVYAGVGSDITFHEGKIYFSDKHENTYYLFILNPSNGVIDEYQKLEEINSNLHPPRFHNDKMFLLDSKNTLHIYQGVIL